MKITYYIQIFLLMAAFNIKAQPGAKVQALKIGDTIPDVELKMVNYPKPALKLADLKGKTIIIDFWATWCQPCIADFPKQELYKNKYKDKLVILPVSHEKSETVIPFLNRMNKTRATNVYSAVEDKTLSKLFPHSSVPRYVWINSRGIVQAISAELKESDVETFVKSDGIVLEPFQDLVKVNAVSMAKLFSTVNTDSLANIVNSDTSIVSFKLLRKQYSPGSFSGFKFDRNRLVMTNMSLLGLFKVAYREGFDYFSGMYYTRLITSDSSKFTDNYGPGHYDVKFRINWMLEHGMNYILKLPESSEDKKYEILRNDLAKAFPEVKAWIQKEDRDCLVLRRIGNADELLATKGGKQVFKTDAFLIEISNTDIADLGKALFKPYQKYMILNETGIKGKIDLHIETEIGNLEALNKALKGYGLILQQETRKLDILVVKDEELKS